MKINGKLYYLKMKKYIYIIFLFVFCKVYSQSNYNYKFTYRVTFQEDSTEIKSRWAEDMVLLVNEEESLYVSPVKIIIDSIRNDVLKKGGGYMEIIEAKKRLPRNIIQYSIRKKYKAKKTIFQDKIFNRFLEFDEQLYPFKWELKNETKLILGYKCSLAETKYKGRIYKAWYSVKMPIQNGPWKFGGLPGLIFQISDSNNHYSFILQEIKKETKKFPPLVDKNKLIKTTKDNYKRAIDNILNEFTSNLTRKSKVEIKKLFKKSRNKNKNPIELEN